MVQGADSEAIQRLLGEVLAARWRPERIAGVIEVSGGDGGEQLRNIGDGRIFRLYQDLGPGAAGCAVDPGGVIAACAAACDDIAAGCDLVVLSKFGKLEAENGSGLTAAFAAALGADLPILTAVSPRHHERWHAFAAPYYELLEPDLTAIAAWWAAQSPATASSAST